MAVINAATPLGGAFYPFLKRLNRRWAIITQDIEDEEVERKQYPTIRWVNGDHIVDLFVEDMDTQEFLEATGLRFSMEKGGYVLSKRISRAMREYFMCGFFNADTVTVEYMDLDKHGLKVWDGAGLVSRKMLLRVLDQLPADLPKHKRQELKRELKCAKRIEFTLMGKGEWSDKTKGGQDKGHAIVVDDLPTDFVLPRDTKSQAKLTDGTAFVGFNAVHCKDEMRLDIQSLINLSPFFEEGELMKWLRAEGDLFLESIRSGDVTAPMSRIDDETDLEDVQTWHLREYVLSGGHPMWFGSIVKALVNQHLTRINHTTLRKMRLPIPGARYYVMCDVIGGKRVAPGEIMLDPEHATAWVNENDWCDHIAEVLGGADQDDALWCFAFEDHQGEKKILAWRSPNQLGEYMIFKPAAGSHIPEWATTTETIKFPKADSRKLKPRIDTVEVAYLNLIDEETAGGLGEWLEYSIEAMQYTVQRAIDNRGALGMYCNALMLSMLLYNRLPANPPAPLEQVIDGSVKTGVNLAPIREWCQAASAKIIEAKKPVPLMMQDRLSIQREKNKPVPTPVTSCGHWFDNLVVAIEHHITYMENMRDQLMTEAMPPLAVFEAAFEAHTVETGAKFNQLYTSALPWTKQGRTRDLDLARTRSSAYLVQHELDEQSLVLIGAIAHYYMNPDHKGADEAVWQLGEKSEEGRETGIAQRTIAALRAIGVLDEIAEINDCVLRYPAARILVSSGRTIKIAGVWFNYLNATLKSNNRPIYTKMGDVPKEVSEQAKTETENLSSKFREMQLTIQQEGDRKIVWTDKGNIFGYIAKEHNDLVGDVIRIKYAVAKDGSLLTIIE